MPLSYYFVDFYEEIRAKAPIVYSHYRQIVIDETLVVNYDCFFSSVVV